MIKNDYKMVNFLINQIRKNVDIAVIGMSGGADSTLVATLCKLALGPENVYSLHMPYSDIDKKKFNSNSIKVAKKLKVNIKEVNIKNAVNALTETLGMEMNMVNLGNARSRIRMNLLYAYAHELGQKFKHKKIRVMGTGNLSEDYIGYDTKGGDALADIFPIGELFKSEVYELLEYFVKIKILNKNMIDYNPSAGLWDGQTDEKELGYTYKEMETSIRKFLKNKKASTKVDQFVEDRHLKNKHKHEAPPVIKLRDNKGLIS